MHEPAAPTATIRRLDRAGDVGWVVQANGEQYAREFGWDPHFEVLVARIVADFADGHDDARERAWIAEVDGRRVGCVFCVSGGDPRVARLRILLVTPEGRGVGLGAALVDTCLQFARDAGYERVTLWTNDVLTADRHLYVSAGFTLVDEEEHHSFGQDLVGETWELDLLAG